MKKSATVSRFIASCLGLACLLSMVTPTLAQDAAFGAHGQRKLQAGATDEICNGDFKEHNGGLQGKERRLTTDPSAIPLRRWATNTIKFIDATCSPEWGLHFAETIVNWGYSNAVDISTYHFLDDNREKTCFSDPNSTNLQILEGYITVYNHNFTKDERKDIPESALAWATLRLSNSTGDILGAKIAIDDSMFVEDRASYAYRQHVICHEVGHTLGIPERDVDHFNANRGTCIDYTMLPQGGGVFGPANTHPGMVDMMDLNLMYGGYNSVSRRLRGVRSPDRILVQEGLYLVEAENLGALSQEPKLFGDAVYRKKGSASQGKPLDYGNPSCFDGSNHVYQKAVDKGNVEETMFMGK